MAKTDTIGLWDCRSDLSGKKLETRGALVRNVNAGTQYMVSGSLDRAASVAGVAAEGVGALGLVSGVKFSVRMARERLLIVSSESESLETGWNDEGYAVSSMSSALAVFEISGPRALDLIKRGVVISPGAPGRCAAVNFAGITACLYRFQNPETIRFHVDRGLAAYIWRWFETLGKVTTDL